MNEAECKKAVKELGRKYKGNEISSGYPSGCYGYGEKTAYFNKHRSGSTKDASTKSICKQGIYKYFSLVRNINLS